MHLGVEGRPTPFSSAIPAGRILRMSVAHAEGRYVHPDVFKMFEAKAYEMGFSHAAVGAMVRSSYHADQQAHAAGVM